MSTAPRFLRAAAPVPRRVALLSLHTSPLDQPGTGDAGGMNVYVVQTARHLAARGVQVEIFTRATSGDLPPLVDMEPGVLVRHITAGPLEPLPKEDLPAQLCAFTQGVLRAEAAREPGWYDLVHSHYWLSGHVGWLASERWGVPLIHSSHTLAKVKNEALADGDTPEPRLRIIGEEQVIEASDRLIAATDVERDQLIGLYGADPDQIETIAPGVDLDEFTPGDKVAARAHVGLDADAEVLLFVGRIQALKGPDVVLRAAAEIVEREPERRAKLVVVVLGGPSGSGLAEPEHLQKLASELGITDLVRFVPPTAPSELADYYRAADLVVMPSHNESFGLVALEAQACGTPVVAANVGGLRTAVAHGVSGVLVEGHDPLTYARTIAELLDDDARRATLARGAIKHAADRGWSVTTAALIDCYRDAINDQAQARLALASGR